MASTTSRLLSLAARKNWSLTSRLGSVHFRSSSKAVIVGGGSNSILVDNFARRWMSSNYPPHEVVGLPSLSPVSLFVFVPN